MSKTFFKVKKYISRNLTYVQEAKAHLGNLVFALRGMITAQTTVATAVIQVWTSRVGGCGVPSWFSGGFCGMR